MGPLQEGKIYLVLWLKVEVYRVRAVLWRNAQVQRILPGANITLQHLSVDVGKQKRNVGYEPPVAIQGRGESWLCTLNVDP